jgi:hypothetical protein
MQKDGGDMRLHVSHANHYAEGVALHNSGSRSGAAAERTPGGGPRNPIYPEGVSQGVAPKPIGVVQRLRRR